MQAIDIKKAINHIGNIDIKFNKQESIFLLEGVDIMELSESYFDLLKIDFIKKLNIYIHGNGNIYLLTVLLSSITLILGNLLKEYHLNRVKLMHINDNDLRLIEVYKKIIHLINIKIDALESIDEELKLIVENLDFITNADFDISINNEISENQSEINLNFRRDNLDIKIENPHPRIFKNYDAFVLFEKLREVICTSERTQLADYSFLFRKLLEDKKIYSDISESSFRDFLNKDYQIVLEKLKTLGNIKGEKRESLYNNART